MGGHFTLSHLEFLGRGAIWTVVLSALGFAGGGVLAFLVALCRISGVRAVRAGSGVVVQLVQGTPLLVILFLSYFGLPAVLGVSVPPLLAASASLTLYIGAYLGETWRAAIQAVPRAQWEAAECLALTRPQRLFRVILPQAVHIATPPTVGFIVQIIKSTSLASAIGFVELARSGQIINNSLLQPFLVFVLIAVIYFAICYPLSRLSRRLEARSGFAPVVEAAP
jgi:polar amino acid transport system permease protein